MSIFNVDAMVTTFEGSYSFDVLNFPTLLFDFAKYGLISFRYLLCVLVDFDCLDFTGVNEDQTQDQKNQSSEVVPPFGLSLGVVAHKHKSIGILHPHSEIVHHSYANQKDDQANCPLRAWPFLERQYFFICVLDINV